MSLNMQPALELLAEIAETLAQIDASNKRTASVSLDVYEDYALVTLQLHTDGVARHAPHSKSYCTAWQAVVGREYVDFEAGAEHMRWIASAYSLGMYLSGERELVA